MCLAVPGKVLQAQERNGSRIARVQFGGIVREAYLDFVPEAQVGDYVVVHVGFAISIMDEAEATEVFRYFQQMEEAADREGGT